jgi:hypothetical protein
MRLTQVLLVIALFDFIATSLAQSSIPSSSLVIPSNSSSTWGIALYSSSASSTPLARSSPQSSHTAPDPSQTTAQTTSQPVGFVVPLSTQTLSRSLKLATGFSPSSSASPGSTSNGYVVVNPSNTQQSVAFAVATVPPDQRNGLPSATDLTPAALMLPGFLLPALLFGGFELVIPAVSAATAAEIAAAGWLPPKDYPNRAEAEGPITTLSRSSASETTKKTSSSSLSSSSPFSVVTLHETITVQLGPLTADLAAVWVTIDDTFPTTSDMSQCSCPSSSQPQTGMSIPSSSISSVLF